MGSRRRQALLYRVPRRRINLLTDSEYCVRLFGDNSIKPRCNKALIQRVRGLLTTVRRHHDLSISWIKAHTGLDTPDAVGNATADLLASKSFQLGFAVNTYRAAFLRFRHFLESKKAQLCLNPLYFRI